MSEEQTEPMASSCSQYGSIPGGYQRGGAAPSAAQPSGASQNDHLHLHLCHRVMQGLNLPARPPKGMGTQLQAPAKKTPEWPGCQPWCDRAPWLCHHCSVPCDVQLCSLNPSLRATQNAEESTSHERWGTPGWTCECQGDAGMDPATRVLQW